MEGNGQGLLFIFILRCYICTGRESKSEGLFSETLEFSLFKEILSRSMGSAVDS